jgi:hypothetical protein
MVKLSDECPFVCVAGKSKMVGANRSARLSETATKLGADLVVRLVVKDIGYVRIELRRNHNTPHSDFFKCPIYTNSTL